MPFELRHGIGWVLYNMKVEMGHFIRTRQEYFINPIHAESPQARTLLVTGVPANYLDQESLQKLFQALPGGVKKIWINRYVSRFHSAGWFLTYNSFSRNLKDLPKIYKRRLTAEEKLESAETQLLQKTAELRLSEAKKRTKVQEGMKAPSTDLEAAPASQEADNSADGAVVLPREQRPQHRLGWIPFFGKKVDTIDWARGEIRACSQLLDEARAVIESGVSGNGAQVCMCVLGYRFGLSGLTHV